MKRIPVPDPYAQPIAQLRAAARAEESTFEQQWKTQRLAELQDEYAQWEINREARPALRTLSSEDLAKYAPPNGYQLAVDAQKSEGRR